MNVDINAQVKMKNVDNDMIPTDIVDIEHRIRSALEMEFATDMFGGTVEVKAQVLE